MTASGSNFESEFFTWLRIFLKDKELQFSQCGFKNRDGLGARHEIDLGSGYWKEPNYSASKPPRWLYRIIRLCCTNLVTLGRPLSPDRPILRPL